MTVPPQAITRGQPVQRVRQVRAALQPAPLVQRGPRPKPALAGSSGRLGSGASGLGGSAATGGSAGQSGSSGTGGSAGSAAMGGNFRLVR